MEASIRQVFEMRAKQEKREKVERFRRLNAYVKPGQILFVGSSLMEQFPIYEFLQDFDLPYTIYNRGVGGFTTQELLENMEPCVYALQPAHVFINIGTNDLNGPDYEEDALIGRYDQILTGIREHLPQATLHLLAYYPISETVGSRVPFMMDVLKYRTNERINAANERVRALSEQFGAQFIDLNAPLRDEKGELKEEFTIEGMHMYANGYKPVLDQLLPALAALK
jgi:lysophospholipase L1-like esterase